MSGLTGHPGGGPAHPGYVRMIRVYIRMIRFVSSGSVFWVRGVSGRPGGRPADPGDVRMIREKVRMIRAGQTARDLLVEMNFWAEMDDFRGKI